MKDIYYFDNASTSFPKAPGVAEAMAFYLTEVGGNMGRGDYAPAYDAAARALEAEGGKVLFTDAPALPLASTDLRAHRRDLSAVPEAARRVIEENHLYER